MGRIAARDDYEEASGQIRSACDSTAKENTGGHSDESTATEPRARQVVPARLYFP
jgi:hypothetical protein